MAKATDDTLDGIETPKAPKTSRQIGASFTTAEYEALREVRFIKRFDKDTEVVKAAVAEYVEKVLSTEA